MATMKKPAKKMQMGGTKMMMKKGGSFPDLNKDGKITKADILKGRGVIAKKGMKVKKAQTGTMEEAKKFKEMGEQAKHRMKQTTRPDLKPILDSIGAKKLKPKLTNRSLKKGGKMTKKCAYGCK